MSEKNSVTDDWTLRPLHAEFGIEVSGTISLDSITQPQLNWLSELANQYSVVLIRQQVLNDESHIRLSKCFGPLEEEHVSYYSRGEITYVGHVGNVDADGNKMVNATRSVRSQTGNQMWHSDSSFRENPSLYSILYAYEVAEEGGDTEFVSARSAWKRLDKPLQEKIHSLVGVHDYIYSRTKVSEDAVNDGQRRFMYPVRHRLVRQNPVTHDFNFYIGSHVREIEGLSKAESDELLTTLMNEATRPESIYRHQWQRGDLLLWDNRCVLHRGCGYDADRYRRRMHQTRVRGTGPTLAEESV